MNGWTYFFTVKIFNLKDWIFSLRYYCFWRFALADIGLSVFSFFSNPYRVARKFLEKKGDDNLYQYGETPIRAWKKIIQVMELTDKERFYDLGAGRGKGLFFLKVFTGCNITAIEWIPRFVCRGNFFIKLLGIKGMKYLNENFFHMDCKEATCLYINGVCLSDKQVEQLALKLSNELSSGAKIVTISYALSDSLPDSFKLYKEFVVNFAWGRANAYFQKRK